MLSILIPAVFHLQCEVKLLSHRKQPLLHTGSIVAGHVSLLSTVVLRFRHKKISRNSSLLPFWITQTPPSLPVASSCTLPVQLRVSHDQLHPHQLCSPLDSVRSEAGSPPVCQYPLIRSCHQAGSWGPGQGRALLLGQRAEVAQNWLALGAKPALWAGSAREAHVGTKPSVVSSHMLTMFCRGDNGSHSLQ